MMNLCYVVHPHCKGFVFCYERMTQFDPNLGFSNNKNISELAVNLVSSRWTEGWYMSQVFQDYSVPVKRELNSKIIL